MKPRIYFTLVWMMMLGWTFPAFAETLDHVPPAFEKGSGSSQSSDPPDPFDPDLNAPKLIQVQVEFVELSHEKLTELLFLAQPASADATGLRQKVQEMVTKNEAKVLETQMVTVKSGQKSTTESIQEFIYPTEYMPPSEKDSKKSPVATFSPSNSFPFNPATPTAFETRNCGSTLEAEPTLDETGKLVDVRLVPELVWHTGNTVWQEAKDELGNLSKIEMPGIYALQFNASITCLAGQYTLAAISSPKDDNGITDMTQKVMIFVKCDVLSVK